MSDTKPTTETKVEEVTVEDLDNLLGTPGADAAMTPDEGNGGEPNKPSFFGKGEVDMSFLDDDEPPAKTEEELAAEVKAEEERLAALSEEERAAEEAKKKEEEEAAAAAAASKGKEDLDDLLNPELDDEGNPKPGRPKLDKDGMSQLAEMLIKEKVILPFEDDEKELKDYTLDDYKELFQMNFENQKQQIQSETPKEFFESLPQELQYAAKYVADGGRDLKSLFRALSQAEESKALTIDSEAGQERAVRQFLQASNFGTDEEIQEQIDSWRDLDALEAKAQQFKPKLDAMQEQLVQRQLKEQEAKKKQREEQSKLYADSVFDTLAKGELNGVKMSNKVQNMLYSGLIQPSHQSVSGQPTNLFGHLIEKHQYIEPNHGLIAEALWLLADPEGYREEIKKSAKNEANAATARKLKQEQAAKNAGGGEEPGTDDGNKKSPGIKRAPKNFFKRD